MHWLETLVRELQEQARLSDAGVADDDVPVQAQRGSGMMRPLLSSPQRAWASRLTGRHATCILATREIHPTCSQWIPREAWRRGFSWAVRGQSALEKVGVRHGVVVELLKQTPEPGTAGVRACRCEKGAQGLVKTSGREREPRAPSRNRAAWQTHALQVSVGGGVAEQPRGGKFTRGPRSSATLGSDPTDRCSVRRAARLLAGAAPALRRRRAIAR